MPRLSTRPDLLSFPSVHARACAPVLRQWIDKAAQSRRLVIFSVEGCLSVCVGARGGLLASPHLMEEKLNFHIAVSFSFTQFAALSPQEEKNTVSKEVRRRREGTLGADHLLPTHSHAPLPKFLIAKKSIYIMISLP